MFYYVYFVMSHRPTISKRTSTLFPHTSLFLSAGDPVGAPRVVRLARCQQGHFGDARADRLPRVDAVAHATDPHHVAALLVVGIGIEEVVGDILQDGLDELAAHGRAIGLRVGQDRKSTRLNSSH